MIKVYDKLVRDGIVDIISDEGHHVAWRVMTESEFVPALRSKLLEEVMEFTRDPSVDELADICQVIDSLVRFYPELDKVMANKRDERGGFDNRVRLLWVDERKTT